MAPHSSGVEKMLAWKIPWMDARPRDGMEKPPQASLWGSRDPSMQLGKEGSGPALG